MFKSPNSISVDMDKYLIPIPNTINHSNVGFAQ